jgi:hypothetical protein
MRRSPLPSGLRWPSPDRSCCPPTPGPPTPGGHLSSTDTPYRYREADVRPSRVLIQETNSANSTGFQTPVRTNRRTKPQVTAPADTRHTARSGLLIRRFWVRVPGGVRHEGPGQSTWPGPLLLPGRSSNAAFPEWHGSDLSPFTSGPVGRRRTYLVGEEDDDRQKAAGGLSAAMADPPPAADAGGNAPNHASPVFGFQRVVQIPHCCRLAPIGWMTASTVGCKMELGVGDGCEHVVVQALHPGVTRSTGRWTAGGRWSARSSGHRRWAQPARNIESGQAPFHGVLAQPVSPAQLSEHPGDLLIAGQLGCERAPQPQVLAPSIGSHPTRE